MSTDLRKEQALEQGLVQTIFRPCAEFLIRQAQLQPEERLLDIGCGSGIVARVAVDQQPELSAAHGFDNEPAAITVAESIASQHKERAKLKFWIGDASKAEAYQGLWNVCVAQHAVQHVPQMLAPMRKALTKGGRAIICTWPASSKACPACDFLYSAAGEGQKPIGMSMGELVQLLRNAGFRDITPIPMPELYTSPVEPVEFLRQYLEGKQQPPANIEEYLHRHRLKKLADALALGTHPSGLMEFRIVITAALVYG